jgi:hypothetical protein
LFRVDFGLSDYEKQFKAERLMLVSKTLLKGIGSTQAADYCLLAHSGRPGVHSVKLSKRRQNSGSEIATESLASWISDDPLADNAATAQPIAMR